MLTVLFIFLVGVNLAAIWWLHLIGSRGYFAWLRGTVLDPLVFINFLLLILVIDYVVMFFGGLNFHIYEENLPISEASAVSAYFYVVLCVVAFVSGVYYGSGKVVYSDYICSRLGVVITPKSSGVIFYSVSILVLFGVISSGNIVSAQIQGELTRQVIFGDNKLLLLGFGLLIPAFAAHLCSLEGLSSYFFLVCFVCISLLMVSGSRGWLIYASIVIIFAARNVFLKISSRYYILIVPSMVIFLVASRFYFREAWRYNDIWQFLADKNGLTGVFFETSEISMAEVISTVVEYSYSLNRSWYDGLLAAAMYLMPRDVFSFKPHGIDAFVTAEFSPDRWYWTKSEITITVFGDLYLHFGPLLSVAVFFLIGYFVVRGFGVGIVYPKLAPLFIPFFMWFYYVLLRSGTFNGAGPLWYWLIIVGLNYLIGSYLFSPRSSKARGR